MELGQLLIMCLFNHLSFFYKKISTRKSVVQWNFSCLGASIKRTNASLSWPIIGQLNEAFVLLMDASTISAGHLLMTKIWPTTFPPNRFTERTGFSQQSDGPQHSLCTRLQETSRTTHGNDITTGRSIGRQTERKRWDCETVRDRITNAPRWNYQLSEANHRDEEFVR